MLRDRTLVILCASLLAAYLLGTVLMPMACSDGPLQVNPSLWR